MTENVMKIFDILGVEPNEKFKIKYNGKIYDKYYIDKYLKLIVDKENFITSFTTLDIITGNIEIIKISKYDFTEEEKKILRCFKQIGYNYIARDKDGILALYSNKPYKITNMWNYQDGEYIDLRIKMFESIKWQDPEPFEIPDIENEPEYETDKKKIKDRLKNILKDTNNLCMLSSCRECIYSSKNNGNKDSDIRCNLKLFIDELIGNNFTFLKSEE